MSEHVHKEQPSPKKEAPIQATPSMGGPESTSAGDSHGLTPAKIMQLQKTHGNRAVQGMIQMMQKPGAVVQRNETVVATPPPTLTPTANATPELAQAPAPPSVSQLPTPSQAPLVQAPTPVRVVPIGTPLEQRKAALDEARDTGAAALANTSFASILTQVEQSMLGFLTTDKSTAAMRQSITTAATAKIIANIDGDVTATPQQKADAKAAAAKNSGASDALRSSLSKYAKDVAREQVTETNKTELLTQAKASFDEVQPKLSVALEVQKAKAAAAAQKKVATSTAKIIKDTVTKAKTAVAAKAKDNKDFLSAAVDVGTAGTKEIDNRKSIDGNLMTDEAVNAVYTNDLFTPIKKAVVLKFGVGRSGIRRSKELNIFRQKMKDEARAQAGSDIDGEIGTHEKTTGKGEKTKEYYAMVAKTKARDLAKVSVDGVMETEAETIVKAALPEETVKADLKHAGKSTAFAIASANPLEVDKISSAATAGAKVKAASLLKDKKDYAVNEARKITKGDKKAEVQAPDVEKNKEIVKGVKKKVTTDKVSTAAITAAVTADNLSTGLSKLGKLVDLATPNAGDSSELDVELKIPIAQSGGYFLFGFGGSAERENNELTVNTNLTFGVGFQTFGFDASFRIGIFLEAKGKDSTNAMNLMSYGIYQEMNDKAPSAADFFYGQGGKSGETSKKEAEKWARMIEEQDMLDGNYVDVGLLTKLAMEGNVGVAEFSAELAYKRLTRWQKEEAPTPAPTTAPTTASTGGTTPSPSAPPVGPPTPPAELGVKGEIRNVFDAATEVQVKFGKDSVAFGLEGSLTVIGGRVRELKLELSGSVPSQFGEESGDFTKVAAKIVSASIGTGKTVIGLLKKLGDKDVKDNKKRGVGTLMDVGSDALFLDDRFESVGESLAGELKGDSTVNDTMRSWLPGQDSSASEIETVNKIGLSNSLKLAISFEKEWGSDGVGGEWKIALEASQVKSMEVDAEIIKVSVEKSKRLGKLEYSSKEGVSAELGGIDKEDKKNLQKLLG